MFFLFNGSSEAADVFGNDEVGRQQSFLHPQFGWIFGMKIFPVSNFVGDADSKQDLWQPGPKYYRHTVLPQENLSTFDSYKVMDHLYRENHPDVACRYETLMAKTVSRIPLMTHSIWLTNLDNPVELTDEFIRWFKESCSLHKMDKGWKHYLWVQDRNKLPKTVRALESAGVEIKEVYRELSRACHQLNKS
ncbi:hypothetical protein [Candidatus Finniella inopinata]|uniref:Uncharacterized protein n=1 Tax=Candidatus Finniella inopinata TaxID=1696036 RepID=A0A4V2DZW7_9PROT|nr:hypothetical protein [Candidatus Finniella inopinata]RZI46497.1 hypothetical protein EQU50_02625 [Candidatus Finniella inopinata]